MKTTKAIVTKPSKANASKLATATNKIKECIASNSKNSMNAAWYLAKVKGEKLFEGTFENFGAYAMQTFDIAKSRAYALADAAKFVASVNGKPVGKSIFADESGNDFTATHLVVLGKMTEDAVKNALENGTFSLSMSVSELAEAVKALAPSTDKKPKAIETKVEETEAMEEAEESENFGLDTNEFVQVKKSELKAIYTMMSNGLLSDAYKALTDLLMSLNL